MMHGFFRSFGIFCYANTSALTFAHQTPNCCGQRHYRFALCAGFSMGYSIICRAITTIRSSRSTRPPPPPPGAPLFTLNFTPPGPRTGFCYSSSAIIAFVDTFTLSLPLSLFIPQSVFCPCPLCVLHTMSGIYRVLYR